MLRPEFLTFSSKGLHTTISHCALYTHHQCPRRYTTTHSKVTLERGIALHERAIHENARERVDLDEHDVAYDDQILFIRV